MYSDDIDEIIAEMDAEDAARARFIAEVSERFAKDNAVQYPTHFPRNGRMILHRSTREPDMLQISYIDDEGPSGHTQRPTASAAAKRMWDDLPAGDRERYRNADR